MPNWCFNSLRVDGDNKASLTSFREWLGADGFKLSKIAPIPAELENTTAPTMEQTDETKRLVEKYGVSNWYDWQVKNWGTKWDVEAEVDDNDSIILISFDSAWAPPCAAIAALGKKFPDLGFSLSYYEQGMGFAGTLTVDGDEVSDFCVDSGEDKEGYRKFCLDEFDFDPFEHEDEEVAS